MDQFQLFITHIVEAVKNHEALAGALLIVFAIWAVAKDSDRRLDRLNDQVSHIFRSMVEIQQHQESVGRTLANAARHLEEIATIATSQDRRQRRSQGDLGDR
jgi:hypothetical protein